MADFTPKSRERIAKAVRTVERQLQNDASGRRRYVGGSWEPRWYELLANLDAGGTAQAAEVLWDITGDGSTRLGELRTIKDIYGQFWGVEGERIRAVPLGTQNGTILVAQSHGSPFHRAAVLTEVLTYRSSAHAEIEMGTTVVPL